MTYTPPLHLVGEDTFLYVVTDDGSPNRSGTGTVTLLVAPINDAPQFNPGSNVISPEDSGVVSTPWARDILAGPTRAIDENFGVTKQTVSFVLSSNNPALFTVLPVIDAAGILTFTSAPDASGSAVVTVVAVDSGSGTAPNINRSAAATFTIQITPVNDPPAFVSGGNVAVNEDSAAYNQPWATKIVPAAGLNLIPPRATDESAQVVRFDVSNNRPSLFAIAPTIDSFGNLRFTPAADAQGSALVVVKAVDSGASDGLNRNESVPVTFTLTINPTNDAPVGTDDRFEGSEDAVLTINAPGVLANDNDVDLPLDELIAVLNGSTSTLGAPVTLNANGSFSYDPTNVQNLQRLVDGDKQSDTFTYRVRDTAGSTSSLVTVSIVINGVNDAPVAVNDRFAISPGQVSLLPVLANDRDVDTPLDVRTVEIGQLIVNGTVRVLSTGIVEYTPNAGFSGTDSFTYRVRDSLGALSNEATVQIVTNTAPIALPDSASTLINTPIVIDVLRNDNDPDGTINRNSVSIVSGPDFGTVVVQANGTVLYTPPNGFSGTANLRYRFLDNEGLSSNIATVTIRVTNSLHQNPSNNLDVDADGFVSPIDVLILVNDINFNGVRTLSSTLPIPPYLDPNGDGSIGPLDVLSVINFINNRGNAGAGEGEGAMELLGYSQEDVMMISTAEIIRASQDFERKSLMTRQIDFAVSEFSDSPVYGPSLATSIKNDASDESLESYLAGWVTKPKRIESSLDSIFADENWM